MNKTNRGIMRGTVAALAVCLLLGISQAAMAGKPPKGVDPDNHQICTVKDGGWDVSSSQGLTLRQALLMQNEHEVYDSCGDRIIIPTNVTPVIKSPIIITKDNLVLEGVCAPDGCSSINMKKMKTGTSKYLPEGGGNCGIVVAATGVTLKNFMLSGSGSGNEFSGVCFMGSQGRLHKVSVAGVKDGIRFAAGSDGNMVVTNSSVTGISGYGIKDESGNNLNIVVMSNVTSVDDQFGEVVDNEGMVEGAADSFYPIEQMLLDDFDFSDAPDDAFGDIEKKVYMTLSGIKGLIATENPDNDVIPVVTTVNKVGNQDRYHINGIFVQSSTLSDTDDNGRFDNCVGLGSASITRLGVFMAKGSKRGYAGTVGQNSSKGVDSDAGRFDFYIDQTNQGAVDEEGSAFMGDSIILAPVNKDWEIMGRSSDRFDFTAEGNTQCDNYSDDGGDNDSSGGFKGFSSEADCNAEYEWTSGNVDTDIDSDQDGIPDYIEMGVRLKTTATGLKWVFDPLSIQCSCQDAKLLTCWHKSDSDNDGIRDMADAYSDDIDWSEYEEATDIVELANQPVDTDAGYASADGRPDAQDDDSDNDGLLDGWEDRSRIFNQNANAYYMMLGVNASAWYYDSDGAGGERVKCNDDLMMDSSVPDHFKELGVKYALYKAGGEGSNYIEKPIPYTIFTPTSLEDGQMIFAMACVNETVPINSHNFNGILDGTEGKDETDPRDPDTDSDCVCDAHGNGCLEMDGEQASGLGYTETCEQIHGQSTSITGTPKWLNDNCPRVPYPTNDCNPSCIPNEVPSAVLHNVYAAPYVEEVAGEIRLIDANGDTVPDLFQQVVEKNDVETGVTWYEPDWALVQSACPDIDDDNIPDCVEYFSDLCPEDNAQFSTLDPYKRDTDGDGLLDGVAKGDKKADVCPMTAPTSGQDDEFNPMSNNMYSCYPNEREVYTGELPAIASCFMDRDGDGVRDCLEDRNMDGQLSGPVLGLEGIFKSESDPLDTDSDDDGLSDYKEMLEGWPFRTNPRLADTDGDNINDPLEDRDGDGIITISPQEGFECANVGFKDTDPRYADTDGDGLSDSIELMGAFPDVDLFRVLILDPQIWTDGGISHGSDPLAKDSDGDGLPDGEEYSGMVITYYDSNPCIKDSDGDSIQDEDELFGCRLNPDPTCVEASDTSGGFDSDSDGLSDLVEAMLGTNPNMKDTDGDGVYDGMEDANRNGIYEPHLFETDPLNPDTDGDGIMDGTELSYPTDPTLMDTDGDCIPDGLEDVNHNGRYDVGSETDATDTDTDDDGLPDGWIPKVGMGEDLNCNGIRDTDAEGRFLETDPRNPDSDLDGWSDYEEMMDGGRGFQTNNISDATTGREGCSMIGSASGAPTSMFYLMGLLLAATKALVWRKRRDPA